MCIEVIHQILSSLTEENRRVNCSHCDRRIVPMNWFDGYCMLIFTRNGVYIT